MTGTTWAVTVPAPGPDDDALVAEATCWPPVGAPSPLRWARAVMAGVHAAVGDERWAVDPVSLRLTEAWVAGSDQPAAGEVEVTATLAQLVDLGALTALRLALEVRSGDRVVAAAAATVAGRGPGLVGGTRPEPGTAPSFPPVRSDLTVTSWSTAAEPGAVAAFTTWSGDTTPIHTDAEAARAGGLPGPVAPGMFVLALLAAAGARAAERPVRAVGARFVRPTVIGDALGLTVSPGEGGRLPVSAEGPRGPVVRRAWAQLA